MVPDEYDTIDGDEGDGGIPHFLKDPMGIPRRRWLSMLLGLLVGLAGTGAAIVFQTPMYKAGARIIVTSQSIPEKFVQTTVTEDPFSRLNTMAAEVLSRQRLLELVDEFGLYSDLKKSTSIDAVLAIMRSNIEIEVQKGIHRDGSSRQFEVSYTAADPETAAQVANRVATLFVQGGLESRMEHAVGISEFMQRELKRADRELRAVSSEISAFNQANRGRLPSELPANMARLDRLQEQRAALVRQIAENESRLATYSYVADAALQESPNRLRLNALRARYESELAVNTPQHPSVIALSRQLAELEAIVAEEPPPAQRELSPERRAMITTARTTVAALKKELTETEQTIEEIDARVQATPKTGEQLAALEERASVMRAKYLELLHKVGEAEMAQTLEAAQYGPRVSVVDPAQPPSEPIRPLHKLIIVGILGAFGAAVGLGMLFEALDPIVADADQVERITGLPVLGSVTRLA